MLLGTRTLGFYIARKFLGTILSIFVLCTILIFMIDFVELLRQSGKHGSVPAWRLAWLTILRLPAYTEFLLSFAVLAGSIGALVALARKSELAVIRAGGMSVWQFLMPGILVAIALGVFGVMVYNPLAASARAESERLYGKYFGRESNLLRSGGAGTWLRQDGADGQSVINAASATRRGLQLNSVTAFVFDREGSFTERIEGRQATLREGYWLIEDAVVSRVGMEPEKYETYMLSTYLTPERVTDALGTVISVSFWELPGLIEVAEKAKLSTAGLEIQYEMLLSRPVLCLAMVLLAATVSLKSFRSGGIQTMVVAGMVGGLGFFLLTEISRQIGVAGFVAPWVAVWLPISFAILVSTTVLLHQEDG